MKQKWPDETMNQLMLGIRDHHVANKIVKLIKEYSNHLQKIMERLQLTVLKRRKKMNRDIRTTAVYILNNFKRVYNKIYFDLFASIRENLRAADLMIRNIKLIENFQTNTSFDDDFVESSSVTASRVNIIKINISISSIKAIVFKFSISKIVSVTSRKTSQVERID